MKAAIFDAPGTLRLKERRLPEPGPGEARIRVAAAGVCAGDVYIFNGKNPYVSFPIIGGHEIAGTIEDLGVDAAGGLSIGTFVVVEPFIGCGICYPCRVGKPNCCTKLSIIGVHRDGGFAETVIAPLTHVHVVPEGLAPAAASLAEPVAIGVQAVRRAGLEAGESTLILGAGPIGLALVEVVRALGAIPYITDLDPSRLEVAEQLGGRPLPPGPKLGAAVADLTGGEGMPVVIEATGSTAAMASTSGLVAAGGRIVIVGLAAAEAEVGFPALDLTRKEMTVLGSRASVGCFPEALRLLAAGEIGYTQVCESFPLETLPDLMPRLAGPGGGGIHKAILIPTG